MPRSKRKHPVGVSRERHVAVAPPATIEMPDAIRKLLCVFAIETWRMKRKIGRVGVEVASDELVGLMVSAERMESCLRECGVECKGYTDQAYNEGLNVTVLDWEERAEELPDSGLIVQTVAPGVYWAGYLLKPGEVVVARGTTKGDVQ